MIDVVVPVQIIAVVTAIVLVGLCWVSTVSYEEESQAE